MELFLSRPAFDELDVLDISLMQMAGVALEAKALDEAAKYWSYRY